MPIPDWRGEMASPLEYALSLLKRVIYTQDLINLVDHDLVIYKRYLAAGACDGHGEGHHFVQRSFLTFTSTSTTSTITTRMTRAVSVLLVAFLLFGLVSEF